MASTVPPFAVAIPASIGGGNAATQLNLGLSVAAGDGVNLPFCFGLSFTYDLTQPFATNVANLKARIVDCLASDFGLTVLTSNVSVFTAAD